MENLCIKDVIEHDRVIVIMRKMYGESMLKLVEALSRGGMKLFEVTFNQADPNCIETTHDAIMNLCEHFGTDMAFGAGTVLSKEQVDAAKDAGARFIISPSVSKEVICRSKELDMISIPGAMSPTEIVFANNCGADYVKIFPACDLGLQYIKNIRAPLNHIKLVATGGVNEKNFKDHLDYGYTAAGISGYLTNKELVENGKFDELTRRAASLLKISHEFNAE